MLINVNVGAAEETISKSFEFKIRATKKFVEAAECALQASRFVYNCALEQRIRRYRQGKPIGFVEQSRELSEARAELPEVGGVLRTIQSDALERLDFAFDAFFRRFKSGETAGFPRFKSTHRYPTFSQKLEAGRRCPLEADVLTVPGVGRVRVRLSRPLTGKVKQLRIRKRADGWYVVLVCAIAKPAPLPKTRETVGLDVGLNAFATLSTGETVSNPRHLRRAEKALKRSQQALSRKKRGSRNRLKARRRVGLKHLEVQRARKDFHYRTAVSLVRRFDQIKVEDLKIRNLVRNEHLAKSIADAGWGQFLAILSYKAEEAGRQVTKVDPKFTSQTCSACGRRQKMALSRREFVCECGVVLDRDHNAARNIRSSGPAKLAEGLNQMPRRSRNGHRKSGTVTTTGPILPALRH